MCVLKSLYFPDTDFLNAQLGRNPSWMWRSLLATIVDIVNGQWVEEVLLRFGGITGLAPEMPSSSPLMRQV